MTQLVRVQNFCVSTDGFGAGEGQSLEAPFGHAERRGGGVASLPADLASWMFATASWPNRTEPGGARGKRAQVADPRVPPRPLHRRTQRLLRHFPNAATRWSGPPWGVGHHAQRGDLAPPDEKART